MGSIYGYLVFTILSGPITNSQSTSRPVGLYQRVAEAAPRRLTWWRHAWPSNGCRRRSRERYNMSRDMSRVIISHPSVSHWYKSAARSICQNYYNKTFYRSISTTRAADWCGVGICSLSVFVWLHRSWSMKIMPIYAAEITGASLDVIFSWQETDRDKQYTEAPDTV